MILEQLLCKTLPLAGPHSGTRRKRSTIIFSFFSHICPADQAFTYVWENHREDADWFIKADDDTFVIIENLK